MVSDEKRLKFDEDVQNISHLIAKEYHRGVDGKWLQSLIEENHHPLTNSRGGDAKDEYLLSTQMQRYIDEMPLAGNTRSHFLCDISKKNVMSVFNVK